LNWVADPSIAQFRYPITQLPNYPITRLPDSSVRSSSVAEVKVQEGESIESALRRFKRKVQQEDIIKDIKKHSFYLKPGDKRRAKQALARKRNRKKMRRDME
jgi:small subunit ribosomal protein S21